MNSTSFLRRRDFFQACLKVTLYQFCALSFYLKKDWPSPCCHTAQCSNYTYHKSRKVTKFLKLLLQKQQQPKILVFTTTTTKDTHNRKKRRLTFSKESVVTQTLTNYCNSFSGKLLLYEKTNDIQEKACKREEHVMLPLNLPKNPAYHYSILKHVRIFLF